MTISNETLYGGNIVCFYNIFVPVASLGLEKDRIITWYRTNIDICTLPYREQKFWLLSHNF